MPRQAEKAFVEIWPKCFLRFMAVVELIAVIILLLTEYGNVSANFWYANVFAGGWCGIIMLIHLLLLMCTGCCCPGTSSALRVAVISVIGLIASVVMIGFDAYFLAQPSACLLTSDCDTNAVSNTSFSYNMRTSFLTTFNGMNGFQSYTTTQAKFLFQSMQVGIGVLCFMLCVIYLVIYYTTKSQVTGQGPSNSQLTKQNSTPPPPPPSGYYPPPPAPMPPSQQRFYQQSGSAWRPPAYAAQPPPGQLAWNSNQK